MTLRNKLSTRTTAVAVGMLIAAVTAGCSQAKSAASDDQTPSASQQSSSKSPKASAAAMPSPVTKDGPCPYLPTADVMALVGQHISRTTTTSTTPLPSCGFYRPNGEEAASVTISTESSVNAAQQKALSIVTTEANPVKGYGEWGGYFIGPKGTKLAVTKGTTLVVVNINQQSSLEANEIAKGVVAKL